MKKMVVGEGVRDVAVLREGNTKQWLCKPTHRTELQMERVRARPTTEIYEHDGVWLLSHPGMTVCHALLDVQ